MADGTDASHLPFDVVVNQRNGERFRLYDGDPSELRFDLELEPSKGVGQKHFHEAQSETFRVVEGEVTIFFKDGEKRLVAGEEHTMPPGTVHSFVNQGAVPAKLACAYRPALRSADWFRVIGAWMDVTGREPGAFDVAPFVGDIRFFIDGPPKWAQRAVFALLKPIAILAGRKKAMLDAAEKRYGRRIHW